MLTPLLDHFDGVSQTQELYLGTHWFVLAVVEARLSAGVPTYSLCIAPTGSFLPLNWAQILC